MHSQKVDILQKMLTKEQQDLQVCVWYYEIVILITVIITLNEYVDYGLASLCKGVKHLFICITPMTTPLEGL